VREAHPSDEWQVPSNRADGVCFRQPRTLGERVAAARQFAARHAFRLPLAVDRMEDEAEARYAAWPERIYVVDELGRIGFKGAPGPFGFDPQAAGAWLASRAAPSGRSDAARDARSG
jgi:hypothetical protein